MGRWILSESERDPVGYDGLAAPMTWTGKYDHPNPNKLYVAKYENPLVGIMTVLGGAVVISAASTMLRRR